MVVLPRREETMACLLLVRSVTNYWTAATALAAALSLRVVAAIAAVPACARGSLFLRITGFAALARNHPPVHKSLPPEEPSLGPQRASRPDGPFCVPAARWLRAAQLVAATRCGCPAPRGGQAEPLRHRCGRAGES